AFDLFGLKLKTFTPTPTTVLSRNIQMRAYSWKAQVHRNRLSCGRQFLVNNTLTDVFPSGFLTTSITVLPFLITLLIVTPPDPRDFVGTVKREPVSSS